MRCKSIFQIFELDLIVVHIGLALLPCTSVIEGFWTLMMKSLLSIIYIIVFKESLVKTKLFTEMNIKTYCIGDIS